jgi:hypothetical protein
MAAIVFAGVFATGSAQALDGTFDGTISEKMRVEDCGKDTDVVAVTTILESNNNWSALTNEGTLRGQYKTRSGGRKLYLSLDSNSRDLMKESLRDWASEMCGLFVNRINVRRIRKGEIHRQAEGVPKVREGPVQSCPGRAV